jgi:hypothetical protein
MHRRIVTVRDAVKKRRQHQQRRGGHNQQAGEQVRP